MEDIQKLVDQVREFAPDLKSLAAELGSGDAVVGTVLDEDYRRKKPDAQRRVFGGFTSSRKAIVPPVELRSSSAIRAELHNAKPFEVSAADKREQLLREMQTASQKLSDGVPVTEMDEADKRGMEGIIKVFGRPAILFKNGDYTAPSRWQELNAQPVKDRVLEMAGSVGRVNVSSHEELDYVGTAFLIADGILMTNKHVAEEFCLQKEATWHLNPDIPAHIDYYAEIGREDEFAFKIEDVLKVHDTYDIALLKVGAAVSVPSGSAAPKPLTLRQSKPEMIKHSKVYVVGYPAWDDRNGQDVMSSIFLDIYDVKRLQPGKLTNYRANDCLLEHDCSTLGGNSGSAVFDLATHQVLALHFGGEYLVGNSSHSLWDLRHDPIFQGVGINWVE